MFNFYFFEQKSLTLKNSVAFQYYNSDKAKRELKYASIF